jgi:hypothetical protein
MWWDLFVVPILNNFCLFFQRFISLLFVLLFLLAFFCIRFLSSFFLSVLFLSVYNPLFFFFSFLLLFFFFFRFLCSPSFLDFSVLLLPPCSEGHVSRDYSLTFSLLSEFLLEELIKVGSSCISEQALQASSRRCRHWCMLLFRYAQDVMVIKRRGPRRWIPVAITQWERTLKLPSQIE